MAVTHERRFSSPFAAFAHHWREYVMEAAELVAFMVSACAPGGELCGHRSGPTRCPRRGDGRIRDRVHSHERGAECIESAETRALHWLVRRHSGGDFHHR